jgi:hypothetical protein
LLFVEGEAVGSEVDKLVAEVEEELKDLIVKHGGNAFLVDFLD